MRCPQVLLANLSANTVYVVRVRGVARSRFNSSRLYLGPLTAPRQVQLQPDCERVQVSCLSEWSAGSLTRLCVTSLQIRSLSRLYVTSLQILSLSRFYVTCLQT